MHLVRIDSIHSRVRTRSIIAEVLWRARSDGRIRDVRVPFRRRVHDTVSLETHRTLKLLIPLTLAAGTSFALALATLELRLDPAREAVPARR